MAPAESREEERILVLAPRGRDSALAAQALDTAGMTATPCANVDRLCAEIRAGAGAVLVAEEALARSNIATLVGTLAGEPGWSELPIVVLLGTRRGGDVRAQLLQRFEPLHNVTLLDRPVRIAALITIMRTVLRARRRQYEIRDLMTELQRALRVRDQFVAAVSHELRTPLNVILGWTTTLQRRVDDPEHVAAAAKVIDRNARVLWQLVEDLIDVARIASGRFQLRMETVDLAAVTQASVDTLRPTAEAKRVALACAVASGLPPVRGDEVRLQQVIWNVISNALRFTPSGGRIDVTLMPRGGGVELLVADTGAGIEPALLPHIFEPFRQGAVGTGDAHRGLGLGLAIVHHLIELHGGTITAASDGPGRGATFRIRLPAATDTDAVATRDEPQAEATPR